MDKQLLCAEAQAKAHSTFNQLKSVHEQFQKLLQQALILDLFQKNYDLESGILFLS